MSSYAIASLALGIIGLVAIPFIGAILAIVFAGKAEEEITRSGGMLGGSELARAGRLLGYVGLGVSILPLIWFLSMMGPRIFF